MLPARGPRRGRVARHARTLAAASAALLLLLGLTSTAAASPGSADTATPSPSAPAAGDRTFTVGLTQDIDSLNPYTGIVASVYEIWQLNYDSLTTYAAKDFSAAPGLAESWETSADGLTWTYKIPAGLKWSDGEPLTAEDVVYTLDRTRNGTYEQTNYGNYVGNIAKVEAPDDTTVVVTAKEPTPVLLHVAVPILPKHVWEDVSETEVEDYANDPGADGIVGSGPFVTTEWRKGQFLRMERNPNWRGKPTAMDEVVFRVFQNTDSLAQALRRGEIDFASELTTNVFTSLEGAPGVTTRSSAYYGFNEIAMNTGAALDDGTPIGDGHPALKDRDVRRAIVQAIDKDALVERVLGGRGTAADSIIPTLYEKLHYDPGSTALAFDPAAANKALDDAGYTKGPDGIRQMPGGGRDLTFRLFGRQNSQNSQQTVQFVQRWLQDIGIRVQPKIVSEDALTEIIGQGDFDLFEWGWVVEPDPDYQLSTFTCGSRSYKEGDAILANLSDSFYCNEEYDALYAKQATQVDEAERAETVKAMQKMLYDDAPYAVTFYYDNLEAYRSDRWTGFVPQPEPNGSLLFQYAIASYLNIAPPQADAAGGGGEEGGMSAGLWIGVGIAVVVGAGGVLYAVSRRRTTADDVE